MFLSMAVWGGVVGGGSVGVLVGAVIGIMRTRRFSGFLLGAFYAALPAPAIAVAVSLIFALFEMLLCKLGDKALWDVPVWLMSIEAVAVLGTLAFVGLGFDGYYVLQSNARPICYAIAGFVIGGLFVVLWYALVEKLDKCRDGNASPA